MFYLLKFSFLSSILFLSAIASSSAVVISPQSTVQDPQVVSWLSVAEQYWGKSVNCPDGIVVGHSSAGMDGDKVAALAVIGGCNVTLSDSWYPLPKGSDYADWNVMMCHVLVHEYGHLLGLDHSANMNDIMYYIIQIGSVSQCMGEEGKEPDSSLPFDLLIASKVKSGAVTVSLDNPYAESVKGIRVCLRRKGSSRCYPSTLSSNASLSKTYRIPKAFKGRLILSVSFKGQAHLYSKTFNVK